MDQRIWFNEEIRSQNFLVPGLMAIIMTLIGTLLTAMVMAREWERGTMEALLVTPVSRLEIVLGKLVPYYVLGMGGMALCITMAVFLFHVPFRGSLLLLLGMGSVFMFATLGLGLFISSAVRNQFLAGQMALLAAFLPAFFLSGFIFELASTPVFIQVLSYIVPASYFVPSCRACFWRATCTRCCFPTSAVSVFWPWFLWGWRSKNPQKPGVARRGIVAPRHRSDVQGISRPAQGSQEPDRGDYAADHSGDSVRLRRHLDLTHIRFAYQDRDRSAESRELLSRIRLSPYFDLVGEVSGEQRIRDLIDSRSVEFVVRIDEDFSRTLQAGQPAQMQVLLDGRNSNTAGIVANYLSNIVTAYNGARIEQAGQAPHSVLVSRVYYNANLLSRWFSCPASWASSPWW